MSEPNPRQGKRTPVILKIRFKSATIDQFIERYSVDISHGGIFIRTKDPRPVGTHLKFEFQLMDASPLISGEGTVVWTREHDSARVGVAPGMGVRFDNLSPQSREVLQRILAQKTSEAAETPFEPPEELAEKTRIGSQPLMADLAAKATSQGWDEGSHPEQTPLPNPIPFGALEDDFSDEAFNQPTRVAGSLAELLAKTRGEPQPQTSSPTTQDQAAEAQAPEPKVLVDAQAEAPPPPTQTHDGAEKAPTPAEPAKRARSSSASAIWVGVIVLVVVAGWFMIRVGAKRPAAPPPRQPPIEVKVEAPQTPPPLKVTEVILQVSSTPDRAEIEIDGAAAGVTPATLTLKDASKVYQIVLKRSCYHGTATTFTPPQDPAAPRPAKIDLQLAPLERVVRVTSTPAGAAVFLDGKPTGAVTPTDLAMGASFDLDVPHRVRVARSGFLPDELTLPAGVTCIAEEERAIVRVPSFSLEAATPVKVATPVRRPPVRRAPPEKAPAPPASAEKPAEKPATSTPPPDDDHTPDWMKQP